MSDDFGQVITEARAALDQIAKGNPEGYKALYSRGEDITLGNPFGGLRTWLAAGCRATGAGRVPLQRWRNHWFRDRHAARDSRAGTVEIERLRAKVGGSPELSELALRVTCIYRREDDGWKLLHRYGDPRVSPSVR
jgi:hypothetical protein